MLSSMIGVISTEAVTSDVRCTAAAKVLIKMISMPVMLSQQAMLQTHMVVRESTAPPRGI